MIKINNLNKTYKLSSILNNFSLHIKKGECVAIIGESGQGKTTILNIMGLLEPYDSGTYYLDDMLVNKMSNKKKTSLLRNKIGYLFQNFALIDEESVLNNLLLARNDKENKVAKIERIKLVLDVIGLKDKLNHKVYQLSGGEQQRVAIARLLLRDNDLILADEPTGSLDKKNKAIILQLLNNFRKNNKTMIIVTHDNEVANWCDRIITL